MKLVQRQLGKAVCGDEAIYREALSLFRELWDGRPIRLLGIRSAKLVREDEPEQMSLFEFTSSEKQRKLDRALAKIREKYGEDAVKKGRFL